MKICKDEKINEKFYSREWKEKNEEYLRALEKFLDVVDNVGDEKLKLDIIYKMLRCDEILTQIAENNYEQLQKEYKK